MGEYKIGTEEEILTALGIGSCIAVCIYTDIQEIAGLAHVMLPKEKGKDSKKHADILIHQLINAMKERGVKKYNMRAKIFGGASMFENSTLKIGEQNQESVKKILNEENIEIKEQDTGGNSGRAVWLNPRSGKAVVRKTGQETKRY